MFKGKFWLWGLIILICFGIKFRNPIINTIKAPFEKEHATLTINDDDQRLKNNLIEYSTYKKTKFTLVQNNADVIIERASNNTYSGYKKYSNELATPMAMFFNEKIDYDSNGFIRTMKGSNSSRYVYQKDLKSILEGVRDGKDWSDIGITGLSGKIDVTVPNENSPYYEDTINYMLVNLYDTDTTDDNKDERLKEVKKIYNKCNVVDDVVSYLSNNHKYKGVCISPEIYVKESSYFNDSSSDCNVIIAYSTKEYIVKYDVFVKNDINLKKDVIDILRTSKSITDDLGLRNTNATWAIDDVYSTSHFIEYVNINDQTNKVKVSAENLQLNNIDTNQKKNNKITKETNSENTEDTEKVDESTESVDNTESTKEAEDNFGSEDIIFIIIVFMFIFFIICLIAFFFMY